VASAGRSEGLTGVTPAPRRHAANNDTMNLTVIGQHDGDDITGRHPMAAQRGRRALHRREKLGIVQIGLVVGYSAPQSVPRGALIGKCR
jgi:hypothetical protein